MLFIIIVPLISFDLCIYQWNNHHNQDNKQSHNPQNLAIAPLQYPLLAPHRQTLICFLSLWIRFPFLGFCIMNVITLYVLLLFGLVSFTQHNYFEIHTLMGHSFSCWVLFHYRYIATCLSLLLLMVIGFFPGSGYYR